MALKATRPRRVSFKIGRLVKRERKAVSDGLDDVLTLMRREVRNKIGTPYPPASTAGNPPHKRTGYLRKNVKAKRKGHKFWMSVPQYGTWLDGGTTRMDARPFIRVTINDRQRYWARRTNEFIRKRATLG